MHLLDDFEVMAIGLKIWAARVQLGYFVVVGPVLTVVQGGRTRADLERPLGDV